MDDRCAVVLSVPPAVAGDDAAVPGGPVPDDLGRVQLDHPAVQAILLGYEELRRRDTLVESEKWHWKCGAFLGWLAAIVLTGMVLVLWLQRRDLEAFVQLVQVVEGQVQSLGVPVETLRYTPTDAQWLDMLAHWIHAVQWRDTGLELLKHNWRWAALHTCPSAQDALRVKAERDKPFAPTNKQMLITLESITKTPAPESYHAEWNEAVIEQGNTPIIQRKAATFTVGRIALTSPADVLQNRLGLCVAAFDIVERPGK